MASADKAPTSVLVVLWVIAVLLALLVVTVFMETSPKRYTYSVIGPSDLTLRAALDEVGERGCIIDGSRRALDGDDNANYELIVRCPAE